MEKLQLDTKGMHLIDGTDAFQQVKPGFHERKKLQKTFLFVTAVVGINEAASVAQTEGVLGFPEGAVRVLFSMTGPALAGLCILYGYNGERAKKGRQVLKWFFYGFYPLHLLLLWLAARAMGTM